MTYREILKKISILKSNHQFREIVINISWLCADKIVRMGLGLIVLVWVSRYLGVEQYGMLNYSLAFVALFTPFATLGLDKILVKHIIRDSSDRDRILGTAFWLKLLGGAISLLLAVGCMFLLRPNDRLTIGLVAILSTAGFFQAFDTIDLWFQSETQAKYSVIAKNIAFVTAILMQVFMLYVHASILAFAWVKVAELAIGAIGLLFFYAFTGHSVFRWRWSLRHFKYLIKESLPFMFAGFGILIYMKIDTIMLGQMIGDKDVGIYSAATRISEVWYFIPMAISSSVAPSIFAAKKYSEEVYYRKILSVLRLMILICVPTSILISFFSEMIVVNLFGELYRSAALILSVHIWGSFFVFTGCAISPWFIAEELGYLSLYRTIIGALSNIGLNLLLIPAYSGFGAAIATLISYSLGGTLVDIFHPKSRKIFQLQVHAMIPFLYSNFFRTLTSK